MVPLSQASKWVLTSPGAAAAMMRAASSRTLMLRVLDARCRIVNASSWLHRFCPMITPTATSMTVREAMADLRSSVLSANVAMRTANRRLALAWDA